MTQTANPSELEFRPRTDPVTFEVLRHRLWQINDEQGRTIINVSGSPVASEVNDFNIALTDAEGNLVMLGPYLIHHTGAISVVVRNAIAMLGDNIGEGDIFLTNDPWMGALHHNDVCCVAPVHHEGRIVAWTACTVHQIDVGGPVPGSWYLKATDTFQEAPRYRFLRIVRGGEIQTEAVETYLTNSRTPNLLELDLRAMVASSNVVKERLAEAWERYGIDAVTATMQDCIDYSESMLRQRLAAIPDGSWYAEDYLDHDGHEERVYAIRLRLTKRGSTLHFDYTRTDDQAPGFINCTYAGCLAGTLSPVLTQLCDGIPWNQGVMRCVEIATREGILNNASFPAPVGMGTISSCHHTSNASMSTVSKMLSCGRDGAHPPMANWSGSPYVYNVFGKNQAGLPFGTMLVDSHLGAAGARTFADGYSTSGVLSVPRASVPNVESVESLYPLLYLYRRRTPDSGGAGLFRGGVSGASAIALYGVDRLNVTVSTIGAQHSCAAGLGGGYPGAGVNTVLVRGSEALEQLESGALELEPRSWGGEYTVLPSKEAFVMGAGDVLITMPHGGGGFRDPLLRDPDAVRHDVLHGYVSRKQALATYGVVLEDDAADIEATAAARRQRREARIGRPPAVDELPPTEFEGWERLGEAIRHRDGAYACAHCTGPLEFAGDNVKEAAIQLVGPIGRAGPLVALRWDGDSPGFQLHEYACPSCGYLLDVQVRRRGDDAVWRDYVLSSGTDEEPNQ
jgi:N-methylhydantoinase B